MATTLTIDDVLLERARRLGKLRTKRETVTQALTEFIQRLRQRKILNSLDTARMVYNVHEIAKNLIGARQYPVDLVDPFVRR